MVTDDEDAPRFEKVFPKQVQEEVPKGNSEINLPEGDSNMEPMTESKVIQSHVFDEVSEFNFAAFLKLVENFKKIILVAFKKNDLNQYYCSQYVRVPIRCLVIKDGPFKFAQYKQKIALMEHCLELAKEGLWDKDLDALGQLNFYEAELFGCLENQEDYHTIFIRLLTHISSSKAPNLQNFIRDNLIFKFLSKTENFNHLIPKINEEKEEGKTCIEFQRNKNDAKRRKIYLDDFVQESLSKKDTEMLTNYFYDALKLVCCLQTAQSKAFELRVIRYFPYSDLIKVSNSVHFSQIGILVTELISLYHQKYFEVPFVEIPKQLQILGPEENKKEINKTIEDAMKTLVSQEEKKEIELEGGELILSLDSIANTGVQTTEIEKLIDSTQSMDDIETARIILDSIKKIFESSSDVDLSFLKKARGIVVKFIKQATGKKSKLYYDFIKYALSVFNLIEKKSLDLIATEISEDFKQKYLLSEKPNHQNLYSHSNEFSEIMSKMFKTSETITMLLDIVGLGQEHLMSDVIQQLKRVASSESGLYKELNKFMILEDYESLKKVNEIIKITFRLKEISRELFFCKDNLIPIELERLEGIVNEIYEHHWQLWFMIYDTSKHFRFPSDIPSEYRFRDAFETEKNIRWDYTVKMREEAISKSYQKIFNILKTWNALIDTQHWLLERTNGFTEEFRIQVKAIRLNYLIIAAFVYKNKDNQNLLAGHKGIIRQYYNQHFMNQSPDALFTFAEIHRDHKKFLKLPLKYQYDITLSSYVGTISRAVSNASSNGYLAATLISYHFLCKALIPSELFHPVRDLKVKWTQMAEVASFTKLNILENKEEYLPYGYFEARETMIATLDNFDCLASNPMNLNEIQSYLPFSAWIGFFRSPNYLLQYELKNYLCKCIVKFYYENEGKIKLLENNENCVGLISCLVADIIFFRDYMTKRKGQNTSDLLNLCQAENFLTTDPNYKNNIELYGKATGLKLDEKILRIYLEEISLHNLLREYIYGGCLDLLFNILLKEVDYCCEIQGAGADIQTIIGYSLDLFEEILQNEYNDTLFPHAKFEKFFNKASGISDYYSYKDRLIDLTNKFYPNFKSSEKPSEEMKAEENKEQQVESISDNFSKYLSPLNSFKKENKEQNIKQIAERIAEHSKAKEIIREIMKYFKGNATKLEPEETVFILRLLRKYIEIQNTGNQSNVPIGKWKDIANSDLKKIEKIQHQYRELGLSEILFSLFTINEAKIFRESILMSIAYMYGGNSQVQQEFYTNFKNDDDNKVLASLGNYMKNSS